VSARQKTKVPVKVVERAKALAQVKVVVKNQPLEKKAKLVAALKRLHPMD
jgi:LysM repeat protein